MKKKILTLCIAAFICFSFAACGTSTTKISAKNLTFDIPTSYSREEPTIDSGDVVIASIYMRDDDSDTIFKCNVIDPTKTTKVNSAKYLNDRYEFESQKIEDSSDNGVTSKHSTPEISSTEIAGKYADRFDSYSTYTNGDDENTIYTTNILLEDNGLVYEISAYYSKEQSEEIENILKSASYA